MATRRNMRPTARPRPQPARTGPSAQSHYRRPLRFEPLEDRRLLALVTITTLDDSVDLNDGLTSLREAIFAANLVDGADTIDFAPALTAGGPATILLTQGELKITDSLTIDGPGADLLTVDAAGNDKTPDLKDGLGSRVFKIDDGTEIHIAVSINGLRLTGGDVAGSGGAITSAENLNLAYVFVEDNAAFSGIADGGGVHSTGSLLVENSRIFDNLASGRASRGGISALAGITIRNSEISGNRGGTGGVFVRGGDVEIADTTISNNIGVGLEIDGGNHTVNVQRTTISENASSGGRGGLVLAVSNGGTALVSNSTIVGNLSTAQFGSGGGAYISTSTGGQATVDHTQVIENRASSGGGMVLSGNVHVIDSEFRSNVATNVNGDGGGLWLSSGTHSISGTTFLNNEAGRDGGAIYVSGNLNPNVNLVGNMIFANRAGDRGGGMVVSATGGLVTISETTIQQNTAAGSGGGAWVRADGSSRVRIENSTIDANSAQVEGGGVAIFALGEGEATLFQSTVSGNAANGSGGGLSITKSTGRAVVSHSTIALNRADANNNGFGLESGGGIFTTGTGTGRLHVTHTIVAGNLAPPNAAPDFRNATSNLELFYSVIGSGNGSGLTPAPVGSPDANGNLIGGTFSSFIAPQLGPLANHGGPTATHTLLPGSPAINAGDPSAVAGQIGVPQYDQRGEPFTRVYSDRVDIGATELQPNPLPGDYNFNGIVDAADSVIWRQTLDSTTDLRADGDGNGQVGDADRTIWAANFGNTRELVLAAATATEVAAVQPLVMETFPTQTAQPPNGVAGGTGLIPVTVTTLLDKIDFSDGLTSLREAIFATNLVAAADTIDFAAALTASGSATILLTQGELRIADSLTIDGPGANLLTIDASGNDPTPDNNNGDGSRIFNIEDGRANLIDVSLAGLTLTGGDVADRGGAILSRENLRLSAATVTDNAANSEDPLTLGLGGGISQADGHLAMTDCVVSNNYAGLGGGIYQESGKLSAKDSSLAENTAQSGAGLYVASGDAAISRSTIRDNSAPGAFSLGGGIYTSGSLSVAATTISGNSAAFGGGIFSRTDAAGTNRTSISNSTISGNTAIVRGGGVRNALGTTVIEHSTITANTAPLGEGSGVASRGYDTAHTSLRATIVAGNTNSDIDFASGNFNSFQSGGENLIGSGNVLVVFAAPLDQTGVTDPILGPLANNGGPTLTLALLPGSPAIDAGDPNAQAGVDGVPFYDQRDEPFTRVYGDRIDIGAFEAQPNPLPGDYNFNGLVDAADSVVWHKTLGSTTDLRADGNEDGIINDADRAIWMDNFGKNRAGELMFTTSATVITPRLHEPPARPGVYPAPKAGTAKTLKTSGPPAESGAVSFRVMTANRPAAVRNGAASLITSAIRQDAALLAWLAARVQRDARRFDAFNRPLTDSHVRPAVAPEADALDCVFDAVGATAGL